MHYYKEQILFILHVNFYMPKKNYILKLASNTFSFIINVSPVHVQVLYKYRACIYCTSFHVLTLSKNVISNVILFN